MERKTKASSSDSERTRLHSEALKFLEETIIWEKQNPDWIFELGLEYAENRNLNLALRYVKEYLDLTAGSLLKGWRLFGTNFISSSINKHHRIHTLNYSQSLRIHTLKYSQSTIVIGNPRRTGQLKHRVTMEDSNSAQIQNPSSVQERITLPNKHGEKLVGVLDDTGSRQLVVLCHGFRSSKESKTLVNLAAALVS